MKFYKSLYIQSTTRYFFKKEVRVEKVIRVSILSTLVILLGACSTKYVKTVPEYQPIPEPPVLVAWHFSFWGVSGFSFDMVQNWPQVIEVFSGFPAYEAGLQSGDKILEINGRSTETKQRKDVMEMLKGEPGTLIKLTIRRPDGEVTMISYNRGISDGLECIKLPQSIIRVKMAKMEKQIRINKDVYGRKYFDGATYDPHTGCVSGGTGCGLLLSFIWSPTFEKIGKVDTVYSSIPLAEETFRVAIKGDTTVKEFRSDRTGVLTISLQDYYHKVPRDSDLILTITDVYSSEIGSAEVVVPAAYIKIIQQRERKAEEMLKQAKMYYKGGHYKKAQDICSEIVDKYKETEVASEAKAFSKEVKAAAIRSALELRKQFTLSEVLYKHGFTNPEIAYISSGLANIKPENGAIFMIEGLGMPLDLFDAIVEFRKLTSSQKLYVVIFTAEKLASATTGDTKGSTFLYVKEQLLYDWLPLSRSIIARLATVLSKDL